MVVRELVGRLTERYRPLIRLAKWGALLFGVSFVAFTVLPIYPSDFSQPPNAFLGYMKDSFAVYVLLLMEHQLLPAGATIIVIGPFDAFTAIMEIGFYLSLTITIPYLVWGFLRWLSPALTRKEIWAIRRTLVLATFLFFAGFFITYFWLLPPIYQFSYTLQPVVGASGTLSLEAFIETTFLFRLGVGIAFEIPPLCLGLAYVGILSSKVMGHYWNIAGAACFVIAFIISPGVGGGVIETLLAMMLWGLYGLSYLLVRRVEKNKWAEALTVVS